LNEKSGEDSARILKLPSILAFMYSERWRPYRKHKLTMTAGNVLTGTGTWSIGGRDFAMKNTWAGKHYWLALGNAAAR
jgi:hypothetical protein